MFILWILLIYAGIGVVWHFAEKLAYGKADPKWVHDVVAIALAISIYLNIN